MEWLTFYFWVALILLLVGGVLGYAVARISNATTDSKINVELRARERRFRAADMTDAADLTKRLRKGENPLTILESLPPELRADFERFRERGGRHGNN